MDKKRIQQRRSRSRTWGWVAIGVWAMVVCGWAGVSAPDTAEVEREPALRKIDWKQDNEARERINYFRYRLPKDLRKQNNFAWARADIPGLSKKEY